MPNIHPQISNSKTFFVALLLYFNTFVNDDDDDDDDNRQCLLLFGSEYFVFQIAIQKHKDQDIQNYNFACCFVWV
jgi:hypothetical protein